MDNAAWIALGAAAFGAVVGGAASALGSYLLERHRRVVDVRVELYRHLLPDLRPALLKIVRVTKHNRHYGGRHSGDGNPLEAKLEPVLRAAQTGSGADRRHARRIQSSWRAMLEFHDTVAEPRRIRDQAGGIQYPVDLADGYLPLVESLADDVVRYEYFLSETFD